MCEQQQRRTHENETNEKIIIMRHVIDMRQNMPRDVWPFRTKQNDKRFICLSYFTHTQTTAASSNIISKDTLLCAVNCYFICASKMHHTLWKTPSNTNTQTHTHRRTRKSILSFGVSVLIKCDVTLAFDAHDKLHMLPSIFIQPHERKIRSFLINVNHYARNYLYVCICGFQRRILFLLLLIFENMCLNSCRRQFFFFFLFSPRRTIFCPENETKCIWINEICCVDFWNCRTTLTD